MSFVYDYRGSSIENRHSVSVAIVNPDGKLIAHAGHPKLPAYLRSSAKPFQAQALFLSGAIKRFGISQKEIALAAASHEGSPDHTTTAQSILSKIGLEYTALACGVHAPANYISRKALEASGQKPNELHNNCSGKHSGMLVVAVALGTPTQGYEHLEHPVQQLNLQTIKDLSGLDDIPFGIDGCSVPNFMLPLDKAARMFALLADPKHAPTNYQDGLEATFQAMRAHPEMVAGEGEMDTVLMQHMPDVASKGGAEGYQGLALRSTAYGPLGIALKIEDGSSAARGPAVIRVLELLGQPITALEKWKRPSIFNHRNIEVGYTQADIELTWM
jgi:L-asparaginase II